MISHQAGTMSYIIFLCVLSLMVLVLYYFGENFVRRAFKEKKKILLARLLNTFGPKYNERMHTRKKNLLQDGLLRYQGEPGRRLILVEIGAGAGANFNYYPDGTVVTCIDPNDKLETFLLSNARNFPNVKIGSFHVGHAEDMSFIESNSVDVVVCTLVLCSVDNIEKCLHEIMRILKPGGKFFFLEHVGETKGKTLIGFFQTVLSKPWWLLTHCRLAHNTGAVLRAAGFRLLEMDEFDATELVRPTPMVPIVSHLTRPHVSGVATK